jgi:hypothetical protein
VFAVPVMAIFIYVIRVLYYCMFGYIRKTSSVLYFWLALRLVDIASFQDEDQGLVTWL